VIIIPTLIFCLGIYSLLEVVRNSDENLGHPLCKNLRENDWLINHIIDRMKRRSSTVKVGIHCFSLLLFKFFYCS